VKNCDRLLIYWAKEARPLRIKLHVLLSLQKQLLTTFMTVGISEMGEAPALSCCNPAERCWNLVEAASQWQMPTLEGSEIGKPALSSC